MGRTESIEEEQLPPGSVRRVGRWAAVNNAGEVSGVSVRCRHQLADLSKGTLDAEGCLVCPWHQSRYDVKTGKMVEGPKGFLGYHGKTPGYTQFVKTYSKVLRLQVAKVKKIGTRFVFK